MKRSVCEEKGGRSEALVLVLRISLSIALALWIGQSWRAERAVGECCFVAFFFGDCSRQAGSSEGVKGKEKRRNRVWSVILRSIFAFGRIFENQTVKNFCFTN